MCTLYAIIPLWLAYWHRFASGYAGPCMQLDGCCLRCHVTSRLLCSFHNTSWVKKNTATHWIYWLYQIKPSAWEISERVFAFLLVVTGPKLIKMQNLGSKANVNTQIARNASLRCSQPSSTLKSVPQLIFYSIFFSSPAIRDSLGN